MAQVISVAWEKDGNDFIQVYKTRYSKEEVRTMKKSLNDKKNDIVRLDNDIVKIDNVLKI